MTRTSLFLLAACGFAISCADGGKGGSTDGAGTDSGDSGPGTTIYGDEDGDGYLTSDGDCDDGDPDVNPGVEEICDGVDNNCDGEIDENGSTTYYADADNDGFGDAGDSMLACEPPTTV